MEDISIPEESKVGKKLSDLTTRRVIMLVLAMMFSVPLFTISTYKDENNSYNFGLELVKFFENNTEAFNSAFDIYVDEHKDLRTPLIEVSAIDLYWIN